MKQPVLELAHLTGERVVLAPASPEAGSEVYPDLARSPEIFEWLHWDGPLCAEDMAARWGDWRSRSDLQQGVDYVFCLQLPGQTRPVGGLNLRFRGHLFSGDLGYWVLPEFHGRGIGAEAVGLAAWLTFEHLAGQLLIAEIFEGNEPSRRLLERQGFRRSEEGDVAGSCLTSRCAGGERPVWTYTLGRRTWARGAPIAPVAAEVRCVEG